MESAGKLGGNGQTRWPVGCKQRLGTRIMQGKVHERSGQGLGGSGGWQGTPHKRNGRNEARYTERESVAILPVYVDRRKGSVPRFQ